MKLTVIFLIFLRINLLIDAVKQNICTKLEENCIGSLWDCSRSIPCVHGECDSHGSCSCHACWHGENCNQYTDDHPPQFLVKSKYVSLKPSDSGLLFMADAYDADSALTCPNDSSNCPCALLEYSLISGNEENIFSINKETGAISLVSGAFLYPGKEYNLKIKVSNNHTPENDTYDYQMFDHLMVLVSVTDADNDVYFDQDNFTLTNDYLNEVSNSDEVLKRKKRSMGTEAKDTVFTLTQEEPENNEITLGNRGKFKFEILLPEMDELDLSVEIFTEDPEKKTTSLILCQVKVEDAGKALISSKGDFKEVEPELKTNDEDQKVRAIFDFGKVTSTENTESNTSGILTITFVAVLVNNSALEAEETYFVTAGAKYNNDDFVVVSHAEIKPNIPDDYDVIYPTKFEMFSENSEIYEEEFKLFTISAYIAFPETDLSLDVFTPKDEMIDYYSIGNIRLHNNGENFPCLRKDKLSYTLYFNDSETENSKYLGTLNLGKILNCDEKRKKEDDNMNLLEFEIALYALRGAYLQLENSELYFAVGMMLGERVLWTGVANITIKEFREQEQGDPPKIFTISPIDNIKFPEGGIAIVQFRIEYADKQFYNTKLEISVSDEDSMSLCKASLVYRGFNIPYVRKFEHEFTRVTETNASKSLTIDLGRIQTTGQLVGNETANSIIVEIGVHSLKAVSDGTVTLKVADAENTTGKMSTEKIDSAKELYDIKIEKVIGSEVLFATGETSINIEVELFDNSFYEPFDIEVMGSFGNNTIAAKICRVEVLYAGRLLPCLNKTIINEAAYYNKTSDTRKVLDRGIMPFERVCTATQFGDTGLPDRRMIVNFVAELPPQEEIADISTYWLNAGIQMGQYGATVGSVQYQIGEEDMSIEKDCGPTLSVKQQNDTAFGVDSSFYLLFRIKLPSRSRAKYKLTIQSKSDSASICKVAFIYVGHNMPCIDTKTFPGKVELYSTTWLNYEVFSDPTKGNEKAVLDFGSLANVGSNPLVISDKNDRNTLYIGAPIRINSDASDVDVEYVWEVNNEKVTNTETIKVGSKVDVEGKVEASITTLDGNNNIYNKVTKIVCLDLQIPNGFIDTVNITFEDKDKSGKITFCSASLTHIGLNLPCINASIVEPKPSEPESPSECSSSLVMDLGKICHSWTFYEPDESRIRIEVAVNAIEDLDGDVTVVAKIETPTPPDDQSITLSPTSDSFAPISKLLNDSAWLSSKEDIIIPVSKKEWIPINISVPLNTTVPIIVTAVGESDETRAIITIYDIRLKAAGVNLRCMRNRTFIKKEYDKSDIDRFSQFNKLVADFGYATNLGFTYRRNDYQESDNNLTIEVLVRMTDHPKIENDSKFAVSLLVESDDTKIELIQNVVAKRDGSEKDEIEMEVTVNDTIEYKKDDEIQIDIIFRLTNISALEPGDVMIRFLRPPFVEYKDHTTNITNLEKSDTSYLQFVLKDFLYEDVHQLNTTLLVDPNGLRKAGEPSTTIIIMIRAICKVMSHEVKYDENYHFCSSSHIINLKVSGSECDSFIGKKSEKLQDCQMSASSAMDKNSIPSLAEIGSDDSKCWSPAFRNGLKNEYYQIDFGSTADVREIQIQKCSDDTEPISKYRVSSSSNGKIWKILEDVDAEYKEDLHIKTFSNMKGRFFRLTCLEPSAPEKPIGARIEFKGCINGPSPSPEAICKANPPTLICDNSTMYRHFVAGKDDSVYLCEYLHPKAKLACFCSVDLGKSFKPLPGHIGYLLGYNSDKGYVVASDKKGRAKMKTSNCKKWEVAKKEDWESLENSIVVPAYPPDKLNELKMGKWTADFDGLKIDDKLKLSWKECCKS